MAATQAGLIVAVVFLGGCCLTTATEVLGEEGTGGATSGGSGSGSSLSGGGSSTGADRCAGIYCAPSFACDPATGVCECDGKSCTGNCNAETGACVAACVAVDGGTYPVIGESPYAVSLPTAHVGRVYAEYLQSACGRPPLQWKLLSGSLPAQLNFYPDQGEIEGVPMAASGTISYEFEIEAMDSIGNTGVQNYLLEVVGDPGS